MRKHLERTECWQERSNFSLEPVTIPDATPAVLSPSTADPLPATRGHDDAILLRLSADAYLEEEQAVLCYYARFKKRKLAVDSLCQNCSHFGARSGQPTCN
ncbi:hypothetical protein BGX24_003888, partial [Mortierella sp. AD032]